MSKNIESTATSLSKRKIRPWLLRAGFALLALAVFSCGGPGAEQGAEDPAVGEEQAAVDLEHPSLGEEDAPVVLTEYADYQ